MRKVQVSCLSLCENDVSTEYDLARKFIYGPGIDEPICMIDVVNNDTVYYYHFDGLGSIVALSDDNGNIVEQYSYDVFGEPNRTSSIGNPYFFTGRRYDDETDNYYYRARYYKPSIGRFLQTDPIGYAGGLNLYTYCGSNSLYWIDPWGLDSVAIYDGRDTGGPKGRAAKGKHFKQAANDYDHHIQVDNISDAIRKLKQLKNRGVKIDDLYIFDHGVEGLQEIGGESPTPGSDKWSELASTVEEDGRIHLMGCKVAKDELGKRALQWYADRGNRIVDAYDDDVRCYSLPIPFFPDYSSDGDLWRARPGEGTPVNITNHGPDWIWSDGVSYK